MKTWNDMKQEVLDINTALGWWDKPVSFGTAMALLHSEVSEALQAWRSHGLEVWLSVQGEGKPLKPEGVGSEFADILIRLLDDDARYSIWLDGYWDNPATLGLAIYDQPDDFPDNIEIMHRFISMASTAHEAEVEFPVNEQRLYTSREQFGNVVTFLIQMARLYNIDLSAEYERKLAYNKTRPYRHGNRRV